jgi:hypothetical protein
MASEIGMGFDVTERLRNMVARGENIVSENMYLEGSLRIKASVYRMAGFAFNSDTAGNNVLLDIASDRLSLYKNIIPELAFASKMK